MATVFLFGSLPKGFIPSQDTDQIIGTTEASQDASFDAMVKSQQAAAMNVFQEDPNVEVFFSSINAAGGNRNRVNSGRFQFA